MFQFRRFPPYNYVFIIRSIPLPVLRFPHSEIHGSQPIRGSPWLIAAYHVLLRLPVTRHSPCALSSLTFHICSASFWQTPQKKDFWSFSFQRCGTTFRPILIFFAIVVFFARRTKVRLSLENNDSLLKNLAEDKTESDKHRFDLMSKL